MKTDSRTDKQGGCWQQRLVRRFIRMFKCDTARITSPCDTHFLVLGWNERSEGQWHDQDGKPKNFDYVREEVVASGKTVKELIASAKHYKKLLGMKWSDYFREELGARKEVVEALEAHGL
jgi:hypothetical protein